MFLSTKSSGAVPVIGAIWERNVGMKVTQSEVYGKVQGKKALMIYSSYTGNTEKIA